MKKKKNTIPSIIAVPLLASTTLSQAAVVVWDNGFNGTGAKQGWASGNNWSGTSDNTVPTSGTDSVSLTGDVSSTSKAAIHNTQNIHFVIASGQSVIATTSTADMRLNGKKLTISSGAIFDLTNGGTVTGFIGGLYNGVAEIIIDSGATEARIDSFTLAGANAAGGYVKTQFLADSAGAVKMFTIDNDIAVNKTRLSLDLSATTNKLGTYVLYDYGSISGSFNNQEVLGLDAGQSWTVNTAYDLGGGDLGVAITVVPEPSSSALLGIGMAGLLLRRRRY